MSAHTPGPWTAEQGLEEEDPNRWHVLTEAEPQWLIAVIENGAPGDTLDTEEANARLFAASPALLKACKAALGLGAIPTGQPEYRMLEEAIALAEVRP